jgi:hypothetical protein
VASAISGTRLFTEVHSALCGAAGCCAARLQPTSLSPSPLYLSRRRTRCKLMRASQPRLHRSYARASLTPHGQAMARAGIRDGVEPNLDAEHGSPAIVVPACTLTMLLLGCADLFASSAAVSPALMAQLRQTTPSTIPHELSREVRRLCLQLTPVLLAPFRAPCLVSCRMPHAACHGSCTH